MGGWGFGGLQGEQRAHCSGAAGSRFADHTASAATHPGPAGAAPPTRAQVCVWSVKTGRLLDVLAGHEGPVCGLAFSPSQPILASCSWDKTVRPQRARRAPH